MKSHRFLFGVLVVGVAFASGYLSHSLLARAAIDTRNATIEYDKHGRVNGIIHWPSSELSSVGLLKQLRYIDVDNVGLQDDDLAHIAGLDGLTIARFPENRVTDAGLAHFRPLTKMTNLCMRDNPGITDQGLPNFYGMTRLRKLDLRGTNVTTKGVQELRKAIPLLDVMVDNFRFSGLNALQDLNGRVELDEDYDIVALEFTRTTIADDDLKHLQVLPRLRMVHLGSTGIGDDGLAHLADIETLQELWLSRTKVTDDGLEHLRNLKQLRGISLTRTSVTDDGLAALGGLEQLEKLHLGGTATSDAGLTHLSSLQNLKGLWLEETQVTGDGARQLREALPELELHGVDLTVVAEVELTNDTTPEDDVSEREAVIDSLDEVETRVVPG